MISMASRRKLLYGAASAILSVLAPRLPDMSDDGQTVLLTVENETNANLEIEPNHSFVSEAGDSIDIDIGDAGSGLEPNGLTEFEEFVTITNPDEQRVQYGIETGSNDIGPNAPVDLKVGGESLVIASIAEGRELDGDETVDVSMTVDFLEHSSRNVDESVPLVDDRASIEVETGDATGEGESSATLNGELVTAENTDDIDVWFEYGIAGTNLPNQTVPQNRSATGEFSDTVDNLESDTTYEYRAIAEAEGIQATGDIETVRTDDSGCFITTATVGESDTLDSLRRFRDESMTTTRLGRALVGLYYRISPPIASTLERHPDSYTVRVGRPLVRVCGTLSDAQERTDSRPRSVGLATVLTILYAVGVGIAAWGYVTLSLSERLGKLK